ncbi:MAG TPA: hypothetical protein VMA30_14650 [Xanthobacteraceae bacterium]|nr:hypothetical protein [Xanthobacteraceae bacterium]
MSTAVSAATIDKLSNVIANRARLDCCRVSGCDGFPFGPALADPAMSCVISAVSQPGKRPAIAGMTMIFQENGAVPPRSFDHQQQTSKL